MIKKIVIGIIIILIASLGFYGIYKNRDNNNKLETVKVADTTLTSRTYMISYKQYISK